MLYRYLVLILSAVLLVSAGCDSLAGTDGRDGRDGRDGVDGIDGVDGVNGSNGIDGADGADGADGPAGPEGPRGPSGPPGPEGPQGPPGTGNSTMIVRVVEYSVADVNAEEYLGVVRFEMTEITEDVYTNGHVSVLFDLGGRWLALPWTLTGPDETIEMTYGYEPGGIFLLFTTSGDILFTEGLPEGRLKVIIVPPSDAAGKAGRTQGHRIETFGPKVQALIARSY